MAPQPPKPPVNLEIRAPAELLLGVPVGLQANWRHQPADLVAGLIKYEVNVKQSNLFYNLKLLIKIISIIIVSWLNGHQGTSWDRVDTEIHSKTKERSSQYDSHNNPTDYSRERGNDTRIGKDHIEWNWQKAFDIIDFTSWCTVY